MYPNLFVVRRFDQLRLKSCAPGLGILACDQVRIWCLVHRSSFTQGDILGLVLDEENYPAIEVRSGTHKRY
jgi:hypothetical protein